MDTVPTFLKNRLFSNDVVGQEAETINFDGDIQITPFNLKEELEDDGHFDSSGTFIFKKVSFEPIINTYLNVNAGTVTFFTLLV